MWIHGFNDELLPKILSMRRDEHNFKWKGRFYQTSRYKGQEAWKIAERIINDNIGKSYNKAFSYYCRKVPKSLYWWFDKQFKKEHHRAIWYGKHYIVEDGIIQKIVYPIPKHPIVITSSDYEQKVVFKGNHKIYEKNYWYIEKREEIVVIKGWKKEFKNTGEKEYIRLNWERYKERLRKAKYAKRYRYYISYSYYDIKTWKWVYKERTKEELKVYLDSFSIQKGKSRAEKRKDKEKLRKEKELETKNHAFQTMERKGFDTENSFRN